jgi:hypothetical protein
LPYCRSSRRGLQGGGFFEGADVIGCLHHYFHGLVRRVAFEQIDEGASYDRTISDAGHLRDLFGGADTETHDKGEVSMLADSGDEVAGGFAEVVALTCYARK